MNNKTKEELILEWKQLRGKFYNVLEENISKFEKKHGDHPLYESVVGSFDKSFKEVNQVAEYEIDQYLANK